MSSMSRSPSEVFSKSHNPRNRRELIDYNYLNKLNPTELEWLAKFTDEFYGASFERNPAFMRTKELISVIETYLLKEDLAPKKRLRWENHLARAKQHTKKFIQISENENHLEDVDLRQCRGSDVFYKVNGRMSTSQRHRYADNNIINANDYRARKECNDRANSQRDCILGTFGADDFNDYELDMETYGPEDYAIFSEEYEMYQKFEEMDLELKIKKDS
jgi:hypothetical protein